MALIHQERGSTMRLAESPAIGRFFDSERNTAASDSSQQAAGEKACYRDLVFKPRTTEKASSPPS
jgi:hypothetical protein